MERVIERDSENVSRLLSLARRSPEVQVAIDHLDKSVTKLFLVVKKQMMAKRDLAKVLTALGLSVSEPRMEKKKLLLNELWAIISNNETKVAKEAVIQSMKLLLNPALTMSQQQFALGDKTDPTLAMALLRHEYANFYDPRYLQTCADSASSRHRNRSVIELVRRKEEEAKCTFHPRVSKNSKIIDYIRQEP